MCIVPIINANVFAPLHAVLDLEPLLGVLEKNPRDRTPAHADQHLQFLEEVAVKVFLEIGFAVAVEKEIRKIGKNVIAVAKNVIYHEEVALDVYPRL
jgi:hypothetical protein